MTIKTIEEKTIDGQVYLIKTYENGTVVTEYKGVEVEPEPVEPVEPFDNETAMLELLSMTEYNTCLLEMQMEF